MENQTPNRKKSRVYQCKWCDKVHATKHGLWRHGIDVHNADKIPGAYKCDQCNNVSYKQREKLLKHLIFVHGFQHEYEERRFRSMQDFMRWKESEEQREKVSFVANSGSKPYYNKRRGQCFVCHRSGMYVPRGTGKRRLKSQGSCKINAHCMATMTTIEDLETGVVKVVYQKRHYGHDIDLGHLRLNRVEKQAIATQLAQGTSPDTVLENVKKSRGRELQKIHLVTRRDLHNIAKSDLGTSLVRLREEGPSAATLKVMKQEPPSESSSSFDNDGPDIDQPTQSISAGTKGFINGLPCATFQGSSQLSMVPIIVNQQGAVPLVFSPMVPAGAQNGSIIVFSNPATTVQNRGNPTISFVQGSIVGHKGSSASHMPPKSTDLENPETDEQLDAIARLASGDHSQTVSQAKKGALEAICELQAKIRAFSGSDEKLHHVEGEIRSVTHFLEFGILDKSVVDYGAVEEVSLDDSGAEEQHLEANPEQQSPPLREKKSKAHQDHVYSKKSE
ncbi:uncharacterized protein LOC144124979 [Amblyomma americanum]